MIDCPMASRTRAHFVPFGEALRFWLRLGFISFGGPAGQIAIMHRELVEQKRWISERRFLHALNYCMLLPGPEAQQLATYIGWLMHRTWGGVVAGALFVLPSLFILIGLSWIYVAFGNVPWVAGLFYGIKPAVAAIVLQAVHRIGSKTLKKPAQAPVLWAIAATQFCRHRRPESAVSLGGAGARRSPAGSAQRCGAGAVCGRWRAWRGQAPARPPTGADRRRHPHADARPLQQAAAGRRCWSWRRCCGCCPWARWWPGRAGTGAR